MQKQLVFQWDFKRLFLCFERFSNGCAGLFKMLLRIFGKDFL